jgi:predicted negative regulator of RcsB-dependent stress response
LRNTYFIQKETHMANAAHTSGSKIPPTGMLGEIQSEVSAEASPFLKFIITNFRIIIAVVAILLIAIIGAGIYQWHAASTRRAVEMELGAILSSPAPITERISRLEAFIAKKPDNFRQGAWMELAILANDNKDYAKAAYAFGQAASIDPQKPLGVICAINQSDMLLRAGKADEALAVLQNMEKTTPKGMQAIIQESLAVAAELAGNKDAAVKAYGRLMSEGILQKRSYYEARIALLQAEGGQ